MKEMTADVLRILDDLQRMQYKQKQNGVCEAEKDRYGYPFEPVDAFSTKPLEFVETAMRLQIEALEMFSVLRTLNRQSPLYFRLSGQFEKLLRQLGSCCITKAVIEKQENDTFEILQNLTIESLREMTAFNFRKCFSAFTDSRSRGKVNTAAFDLSVRWSALDKRLIATGEKIEKIKVSGIRFQVSEGTQSAVPGCRQEEDQGTRFEDRVEPEPTGTAPDGSIMSHQLQSPLAQQDAPTSSLAEKGRAFPVLEGTVREKQVSGSGFQVSESSQSTQEEEDRGTGSGEQAETEPMGTAPDGSVHRGLSPLDQQDDENEKMFLREILLREAMDRGDRESYESVLRTPDAGLETLWQDLLRRDARTGFSFLEKMGLFGDDPPPEEEEYTGLFEPAVVN